MQRVFQAPAKINQQLYVLGKRDDGYHDLAMLMQTVTLFDRISLTVEPGDGIQMVCPGLDLPEGADNIAARAAAILGETPATAQRQNRHGTSARPGQGRVPRRRVYRAVCGVFPGGSTTIHNGCDD